MNFFTQIILFAFAQNAIFTRALGTSTMMQISRNRKNLSGFFLCVVYITLVTGFICYFIDKLWSGSELAFIYTPLIYIVILGLIYIITLLCLWRLMYRVFGKMRKYVHISAFNGAVLGALFLNSKTCVTLPEYVAHSVGTGIGFVAAVYMASIVYDKLHSEDAPYLFRGYPLMLIYMGILGMAFFGLTKY